MPLTKQQAKENLSKLVEKYQEVVAQGRINEYNEEATKTAFIQPLLKDVLGWDVNNFNEVSPEEQISRGRVDYCLKIDGKPKMFVEAKPLKADISKHIEQAVRYGYNRKGVPFVMLTDFEGIKLFDVTIKPNIRNLSIGLKLNLFWNFYETQFDTLWQLSKESVINGELDKLLLKKPKDRIPVDKAILDDLKEWREALAKDIYKNNPNLFQAGDLVKDAEYLKEITQRILDRIIFMRFCEDRGLIHRDSLRTLFEDRTESVGLNTMVFLKEEFKHYNIIFDSDLFSPKEWEDNLQIDFKIMQDIILDTYNPYQFDVIPLEVLGNIYEQYLGYTIRLTPQQVKYELKPEVRKAGGVYYTPEYIVDYIVKNTVGKILKDGATPKKLRILDPACGSGSFLIRAYEEMLNFYREKKKKLKPQQFCHPELDSGSQDISKKEMLKQVQHDNTVQSELDLQHSDTEVRLSILEKAEILKNHIFGVDIDEQAVEVTKLSLMLKMLEGEFGIIPGRNILPMLDKNIRCGNSLISGSPLELKKYFGDDYYKVKPFNWEQEFKDVFKEGGFDIVIGNPPYVRIQTLNEYSPKQVNFFNTIYSSLIIGSYDIYLLFINKGYSLLNKNGILGYIVPHKFFQAEMGGKIRDFIYQRKALYEVVDFSTNQIFENATTYTCLFFLTKEINKKIFYKKFNLNENFQDLKNTKLEEKNVEILKSKTWTFSADTIQKILNKIYAQKDKFPDITNKIFKGSSTGNDDIFLLDIVSKNPKFSEVFSKQLNKSVKLENELLVPFLYGEDIRRYTMPETRTLLLFPYKLENDNYILIPLLEMEKKYPLTYKYLNSVKDVLFKRKITINSNDFYKYSAQRSLNWYNNSKILIPDMLVKSRISHDEKGKFFHGPAIHSIIFNEKIGESNIFYYLAILNSELFWFFISNTSTALRGNAYRLTPEYLIPFCFPECNINLSKHKKLHDNLVALVDVMLDLNKKIQTAKGSAKDQIQREIAKTDNTIDDIVYRLYGLTPAEIKLVEGK
jgi:adenine-specific DNA-methyltransferase